MSSQTPQTSLYDATSNTYADTYPRVRSLAAAGESVQQPLLTALTPVLRPKVMQGNKITLVSENLMELPQLEMEETTSN